MITCLVLESHCLSYLICPSSMLYDLVSVVHRDSIFGHFHVDDVHWVQTNVGKQEIKKTFNLSYPSSVAEGVFWTGGENQTCSRIT